MSEFSDSDIRSAVQGSESKTKAINTVVTNRANDAVTCGLVKGVSAKAGLGRAGQAKESLKDFVLDTSVAGLGRAASKSPDAGDQQGGQTTRLGKSAVDLKREANQTKALGSAGASKANQAKYNAKNISGTVKGGVSVGAVAVVVAGQLDEADELEGGGTVSEVMHGASKRFARQKSTDVFTKKVGRQTLGNAAKGKAQAVGQMGRGQARYQAAAAARQGGAQVGASKAAVSKAAAAGATKAGAVTAAGGKSVAAGVIVGGGAPVILGVLGAILVLIFMSVIIGAASDASRPNGVGLPSWVTNEMIEEVLRCQELYGDPAGANLAQMLVESGAGDEPSGLASRDSNLYGMKWASSYSGAPEVVGASPWVTQEFYGGSYVTVTDYFTRFTSMVDCITFRSRVFLQASRYSGNPLIIEAKRDKDSDKMAEGLRDAGWATSPVYVQLLKTMMDTYDLRRFDTMSVADFRAIYSQGNEAQQRVVASATSGQMYGASAGYCEMWVERVYVNAGYPLQRRACATEAKWSWKISDDRAAIPVGAMVFSGSGYHSGVGCSGHDAGHVGIYIGNGKVANNRNGSSPSIDDLSWWASYFGWGGWGWYAGYDLSSV